MNDTALQVQKQRLRAAARARLHGIPAQSFEVMGRAMARRVCALEAWRAAHRVFCFVSAGAEPDTRPLLQAALAEGKALYVPRITGPGRMEPARLYELAALEPGPFGIPSAPGGAPTAGPGEMGLALVPCLLACPSGARLGHGGGYYDRFLAGFEGVSAVLCPHALLAGSLPMGPFDRQCALVVTEREVFIC